MQGATRSIPAGVALQTINGPIVGAKKSPPSASLVPANTYGMITAILQIMGSQIILGLSLLRHLFLMILHVCQQHFKIRCHP